MMDLYKTVFSFEGLVGPFGCRFFIFNFGMNTNLPVCDGAQLGLV